MGFFSSITSTLNPASLFGGGGGGGSTSMSSGGIGSETGNTSNAGNSTTTTTTTTNTDKRQVINSGGVGVATDSSPISITNNTTDPAALANLMQLDSTNYNALLAVTDHLAAGTLGLLAANMDAANNQTLAGIQQAANGAATSAKSTFDFSAFYKDHRAAVLIIGGVVVYLVLKK